MIRLVTFDFWQTLFADSPGTSGRAHTLRLHGVGTALARAGRAFDSASLEAADARAAARFEAIWRASRSMAASEQVRMFLETLDPALPGALSPADLAAVRRAYEEPALAHPPAIAPGAVAAIERLHALGFELGVISNTGHTPGTVLRQLLARAGVLERLRILVFSDETGVRKPAPEIFARALGPAGVPPSAAAHLGDDPVSDVAGARGAGMRAIQYAPAGWPPAASADGVLRHFDELPALLARLG